MLRVGREKQSAMEKLPWKSSFMELERECIYDGENLGWEDAPSSRWPVAAPSSLEWESNRPANKMKLFILDAVRRNLNKGI